MMTCTQKNRAAKPSLPGSGGAHSWAESWLAVTLSLCVCRESVSSAPGSALPSLSHLLHTQAGITWTKAHPQQQAHGDTACRTCSKVTVGWGKLQPAGTQSNSVRDGLAWCNSPKWGVSFKQAGRWGKGTPAAGWQVKHLQCKPGPEGMQERPGGTLDDSLWPTVMSNLL